MHIPPMRGTTWFNSEPLAPAALRGRTVLVDFWTLTCINWLRTQPYVRAWASRYRADGLVVIGVHTPEFSFEHDVGRVQLAVSERAIDYPVAVDNDYAIWNAFDNHYWPALYFVDSAGVVRDRHFGEGRYARSERLLQMLLGVDGELVQVEGEGVEADADWDHLRTPETYLGYGRGERFSSSDVVPDKSSTYEFPDRLPLNTWALSGEWVLGRESAALAQPGGSIAFRFHARDVHLVLARQAPEAIPFRVSIDGVAPLLSHGSDVDGNGDGLLRDSRLYQLVRVDEAVRERTLKIDFLGRGVEAYAFTFG